MSDAKVPNEQENKSTGYERQDVNPKVLLILGFVLSVSFIILLVFLNDFFVVEKEKEVYEMVLKPESEKLRKLHAHENEVLGSYAVLDRKKGIYQIPIERAMELVAREASQKR